MEKLYRYTVAGHTFGIRMPETLDEKIVLKPYLPFKETDGDKKSLFSLKVQFVDKSGSLPVGKKIECFNEEAPFMWLFESGQTNTAAVNINPLGQYVFGFSNSKSHSDCYLFVSEDMTDAVVCLPSGILRIFEEAKAAGLLEPENFVDKGGDEVIPFVGGHHGEAVKMLGDDGVFHDTVRNGISGANGIDDANGGNYGMPDEKVLLFNRAESLLEFVLTNCMMLLFTSCTAPYDTLMTHSSVIRYKGKGYMFLGKSGTGKSTHSSLWLKFIDGAELLNDDNPAIRVIDGKPYVFGTPWSGKTPCYKNIQAPIGAIVRLTQAPENKACRLNVLNAYASLMPSCSCMKWDHDAVTNVHRTLEKVVSTTEIYGLECRPDEEAAKVCFKAIVKD